MELYAKTLRMRDEAFWSEGRVQSYCGWCTYWYVECKELKLAESRFSELPLKFMRNVDG